jgi:hypothetical protein
MLPEPIIGFDLYTPLIDLARDECEQLDKIQRMRELLQGWIPPFALKIVRFVVQFLVKVCTNAQPTYLTTTC